MGATLGDEMNRQRRQLPGLQQADQPAGREIVGHLVGQELGDAAPVAGCAQACLDVVDPQSSGHVHRRAAPRPREDPVHRAARGAEHGLVPGKFIGRPWHAVPLEIGRARHPQPTHMAHRPRRQRRIGKRTDARRHVDALLDQVDVAVVQQQLDLHARVGIEELRDERRDVAAAELDRRGHAQQTTHRRLAGARSRGLIVLHEGSRLVVERPAGLGGRKAARRAIDQPDADTVFQGRERASHGRWRAPQSRGGAHQAALLDDAHEDAELVQTVHRILP